MDCQRHSQGGCTAGLCLEGPGRQHGHLRSWGGTTACFCCWWCPTTVVPLLLQENILFGQQYNKERYQAVLRACALEGGRVPPLLLLPAALHCGSPADSRLCCRCCLPQTPSTVQLMLSPCLPACPAEDIAALPAGSETQLGERGNNLSGQCLLAYRAAPCALSTACLAPLLLPRPLRCRRNGVQAA